MTATDGSAPTVPDLDPTRVEVEAQLLAPDGFFATTTEVVRGVEMTVFANRLPHLRAIVENAAGAGDKPYAIFPTRTLTFGELPGRIGAIAADLRHTHGVQPGDRVAILAANCPEWLAALWATVSLGAIAVGMNGWWAGEEIRFGLDDSEPRLLVADAKRLARLEGADPGVPVVDIDAGAGGWWDLEPAPLPDTPIDEDDPAIILYTSGTTGRPKGAIHTHRNVIASLGLQFFHGARQVFMAPPPPPDAPPPLETRQLITSPLFHVSGLHAGAVSLLAAHTTSVWTMGRFDPVATAALIEREKVTGWSGIGTVMDRFLADPGIEAHDLSSVNHLGGGGAPVSPAQQERYRRLFPNVGNFGYGYGLTESGALVSITFGEEWERYPDSVGVPLPTVDVQIRDALGSPLPDGEEGEIWVRSPAVMAGYWRRPEATAEAIVDGWLRTGDLGRLEGGRLFLASRKRDLIIRGGENVHPAEVEARIEEHPSVAEAAVIGVDHDTLGQEVAAVVVPTPGAEVDTEALAAFVAEALAYYKVPTRWEVRPEPLPRTATNKVMKHLLASGATSALVEE